jgi:hypothetical protein
VFSLGQEFFHGVVEREAEHLDIEVNRVAGHVAVWPPPVRCLDEQALALFDLDIAVAPIPQGESTFLKQGRR